MTAFYERAYNERDKTESGSFAQEYLSYFLDGEPSPGIEYEYRLVQQVLPGITLDGVTTLARARMADEGRAILVRLAAERGCRSSVGRRAAGGAASAAKVDGHAWATARRPRR